MNAAAILPALVEDLGRGVFAMVDVAVRYEHTVNSEELSESLVDLQGTGWIARQSGVSMVSDGQGDNVSDGEIVSAELAHGLASTQVRRTSDGWSITTIAEAEGTGHLADEVRHVTLSGQIAVYRRYWSVPSDGASEIVAWRLVGIEDLEKP